MGRKGLFGKIKLGFKSLGFDLRSIYIKYENITRRKLYWTLWECKNDHYTSYDDFKKSWSPDASIWKNIKKELKVSLKNEVESFLDFKRPFDYKHVGNNSRSNYIIDRNRKYNHPKSDVINRGISKVVDIEEKLNAISLDSNDIENKDKKNVIIKSQIKLSKIKIN